MSQWLTLAVNSIAYGGLLFLLSAGFSLIFGLMRIPNLMHGSFFMLGAYFGVSFLGRPRTPAATAARETDRYSLAAMFFLAALCLVAGVLPGLLQTPAYMESQFKSSARPPACAGDSGCARPRSPPWRWFGSACS